MIFPRSIITSACRTHRRNLKAKPPGSQSVEAACLHSQSLQLCKANISPCGFSSFSGHDPPQSKSSRSSADRRPVTSSRQPANATGQRGFLGGKRDRSGFRRPLCQERRSSRQSTLRTFRPPLLAAQPPLAEALGVGPTLSWCDT